MKFFQFPFLLLCTELQVTIPWSEECKNFYGDYFFIIACIKD